jgi:hypothetical protein
MKIAVLLSLVTIGLASTVCAEVPIPPPHSNSMVFEVPIPPPHGNSTVFEVPIPPPHR